MGRAWLQVVKLTLEGMLRTVPALPGQSAGRGFATQGSLEVAARTATYF